MSSSTMPHWNLSTLFPDFDSPEYTSAVDNVKSGLDDLERKFAEFGVTDGRVTDDPAILRELVTELDDLLERSRQVDAYSSLRVSANANDERAQAEASLFTPIETRLNKLVTQFTAWTKVLDIDALVSADSDLTDYAFPLQKMQTSAAKLMPSGEEALAADLMESGGGAWSKFYFDYASAIEVELGNEKLPMSAVRALAYDKSSDVRKAAYQAELQTWEQHGMPIAAAMNSVKGWSNVLADKRGWESQLDQTLFACNMDRESLEAMLEAASESFHAYRMYLKSKSRLLGNDGSLPWYDLFAPVGTDRSWDYAEGCDFVEDGFRSYSDKMADFARMTFDQDWHDVPPRKGKRDGAFCAGVRPGESRMLHNFKPAFGSVSTLAHELGHAYHNVCLKDRTPLQKRTPMTLAETASIFCETIIKRKAIAESSGDALLAILEASIMGTCQTVVDITSRYRFETAAIEKRKERELSAAEFCQLMADAQASTYGDGLLEDVRHPYMWAAKPHYYGYMAFYNFPYMFGLLFALGLYRIYEAEPNGFHERYDDLLSSTGLHMAADLTDRFGIDIRDIDFWRGSLKVLESDIEKFVSLVGPRA